MKDYIYDDLNSWEILDEMMEDGALDTDSVFDVMLIDEADADVLSAASLSSED